MEKIPFVALAFVGAWGLVILFAIMAVFSYMVFAGRSFVGRQTFAIVILGLAVVPFAMKNETGQVVAGTVLAGVLVGLAGLAWEKGRAKLIPKMKLAIVSFFGLVTAGTLSSFLFAFLWPLVTGTRGKASCFKFFCIVCIIVSAVLAGVLVCWYKYYFLPAWRESRSRAIPGS